MSPDPNIYSDATAHMKMFLPYVDDMEAAGLTVEDMASALIARNADGGYSALTTNGKASAIEAFINDTPEVRALYDQEWAKFSGKLFGAKGFVS